MRRLIKLYLLVLILVPGLAWAISLQVNITGVSPELANSIKADLHLQQATTEDKLTGTRIKNLYELAPDQINATLQAKGYYNSKINADLQEHVGATPQQNQWVATFTIEPGVATKINRVNV